MSRIAVFSVLCALLAACTKAGFGPEAVPVGIPEAEPTMIVLGKKLENPYTTENMRDAFTSLYPSKSGTEIQTTHLYVRFLPDNEDEMETLSSFGLDLVDYPVDYEILVKTAKETGTLLELNNSSLRPQSSRVGARENMLVMLDLCRQYEVPITTGSDAHIDVDAGNFTRAEELLEYCGFPEELVVTTDFEKIRPFINFGKIPGNR